MLLLIRRDEILDTLRLARARGEIRRHGSFGRRGIFDALHPLMPAPSASARHRLDIPKKWGWVDWVENREQKSKDAPLARLRSVALALRDVVHQSDTGKGSRPKLAGATRNEIAAVAAVFIGASEIAAPRRTLRKVGVGIGICVLCLDHIDTRRAKRSLYCEQHDPALDPTSYRRALRRADAVIERLVTEGAMQNDQNQDRLNRLWGMWRAISERVGSNWSRRLKEFERLAPTTRGARGATTRQGIAALRAQGLSGAEIARRLGISCQRVHVLLHGGNVGGN